MNARTFLDFFKSKTGQIAAFGILFFIGASLLTGVLYFRHGTKTATPVAPHLDATTEKSQQPSSWFSHTLDADYANRHAAADGGDGGMATNKAPAAPAVLPISLYHGNGPETEVSDTYAPYGWPRFLVTRLARAPKGSWGGARWRRRLVRGGEKKRKVGAWACFSFRRYARLPLSAAAFPLSIFRRVSTDVCTWQFSSEKSSVLCTFLSTFSFAMVCISHCKQDICKTVNSTSRPDVTTGQTNHDDDR